MSDTRRTVRQSDAVNKKRSMHLVDRKPTARAFTVGASKEILYRFAFGKQEPERIAQQFSRGKVRTTSRAVNEVIRARLRAALIPETEAA